jgi:hypothetical protein
VSVTAARTCELQDPKCELRDSLCNCKNVHVTAFLLRYIGGEEGSSLRSQVGTSQ